MLAAGLGIALAASLATGLGTPARAAEDGIRPMLSGWFGWWATKAQVEAMANESVGSVPETQIFWWFFDGPSRPLCTYSGGACLTGSATPWTTTLLDTHRQTLQAKGIKVLGTITDLGNGRARELAGYIAKEENRKAFAKQIAEWAVAAQVDGVDLDWENFAFNDGRDTWATTKPNFVAMVKELSTQLKAKGLLLSVTVPAGWAPFNSDGSPNPGTGYWVYAWSEIIGSIDRLRIMSYEYSYSVAGPISPIGWFDRVIDSAVQQVGAANAHKIWIGVPQYGHTWPQRDGAGWQVNERCPAGWRPNVTPTRTSPTPEQAFAIAEREGIEPTWDATHAEYTFTYWHTTEGNADGKAVSCKIKRIVWFEDTRAALIRAQSAAKYQIAGIAVWSFSQIQSGFYPAIAEYARSIAPLKTRAQVRVVKTATAGQQIKVRVVVRTSEGRTPGARVILRFAPDSTGKPVKVARTRTNENGSAVFTVTATETGSFSGAVLAEWEWTRDISPPQRVIVTG